ncbi:SDR family oxidoreductase (plasmid) [Sphingobium sp. SJ10-10]|uniref:SDR family NAD(P)-dependent oxidoreductase n=1 Tax=Sphingobium sp. SJ10-10 TaxID=3114999 RepID=UPI002E16DC7A|nr:SDR family oxidoreductase [Sphingobium sp. SJ10-10]
MTGRVSGKIALVTGGASGIGEATVRRFAAEGAHVIIVDRNDERGQAVAREIGSAARFLCVDVTDPAGWLNLDANIRGIYGRLDILVNSAGVVKLASIEDSSLEDLKFAQSVNSNAVFMACQFAVRIMKETSKAAAIVNILSDSAVRPNHHAAAYGISKGSALNITRVVALHCAEKRYPIRCNSILPGLIDTPMSRQAFAQVPDPEAVLRELLDRRFPMRRAGTAEEVASAALFLASDEASYITGASLPVDGGSTAA